MDSQEEYGLSAGTSEADSPAPELPLRDLPDDVVTYVRNQHSTHAPLEPPAKRRKVGSKVPRPAAPEVVLEHVVVHKERVEVAFSSTKLSSHQTPLARNTESIHVQWSSPTTPEYLELIDETQRPILHLPLQDSSISEDFHLALLTYRDSKKWAKSFGRVYVEFGIILEYNNSQDMMIIESTIRWNVTPSPLDLHHSKTQPSFLRNLLQRYFPNPKIQESDAWSTRDFYKNAHFTDPDDASTASMVIPGLHCKLFFYQKRAVQWLLRREGVEWQEGGLLNTLTEADEPAKLPCTFMEFVDARGQRCYISHVFGLVARELAPFKAVERQIKGGILAEEMGLGKTLEIISLIILHKRPQSSDTVLDGFTNQPLRKTGATLIITPPSLLDQWISEMQEWSPSLKVMKYFGVTSKAYAKGELDKVLDELADSDVVVTSYTTLVQEIHFTPLNPERTSRHAPKSARETSPLMKLSWWRTILDEAQQVENSITASAKMARLIPRVNAWCVTGTPVRENVTDMGGLLIFLQYEPYCSNDHAWASLTTSHKYAYKDLVGRIALRHSKQLKEVADEVKIPAQHRHVLTMSFSPIEKAAYQEVFDDLCRAHCLTVEGAPTVANWGFKFWAPFMQKMLYRLRLTALHPQLGRSRQEQLVLNAPLRTADQVLEDMIEQSEVALRTDQRELFIVRIKIGQLIAYTSTDSAIRVWQEIRREVTLLVDEYREQLRLEEEEVVATEKEDGIGSEVASSNISRLGSYRNRLKSALQVLHMAVFFLASGYYQAQEQGVSNSATLERLAKLEKYWYGQAEVIREEILQEALRKSDKLMENLWNKVSRANLPKHESFDTGALRAVSGFQSNIQKVNALGSNLNTQAAVLDDWRGESVALLVTALVDKTQGTAVTGDEYEDSTKVQDKIMAYTQALRFAVADRRHALTGLENNLVKVEARIALDLAEDNQGPCPEKVIELLAEREIVKPVVEARPKDSMRTLAVTLDRLHSDDQQLAQVKAVTEQLNEQMKVIIRLERENTLYTSVMNGRIEYYRQLQELSDAVVPVAEPEDDDASADIMDGFLEDQGRLEEKLKTTKQRRGFLAHLKEDQVAPGQSHTCPMCLEKVVIGMYTLCGHIFCKVCLLRWFDRKHTVSCPACRVDIRRDELHEMTYAPQELKVRQDNVSKSMSSSGKYTNDFSIYKEISKAQLAEINNTVLPGDLFSTKVDTLCRHLIWLQSSEPGAKSIIFSQSSEFFILLEKALTQHQIGHSSMAKGGLANFKSDPSIECFLLHTKDQAAGLNVQFANHVFLCEPMLNAALQEQAMGRAHRIGQERESHVWLYLIEDTVEERIHEISVKRRMKNVELVLDPNKKGKGKSKAKEVSAALQEVVNQELLEATLTALRKNEGRENVNNEDLWDCLFGGMGNEKPAVML